MKILTKVTAVLAVMAALGGLAALAACSNDLTATAPEVDLRYEEGAVPVNQDGNSLVDSSYNSNALAFFRKTSSSSSIFTSHLTVGVNDAVYTYHPYVEVEFPKNLGLDILKIEEDSAFVTQFNKTFEFYPVNPIAGATTDWSAVSLGSKLTNGKVTRDGNIVKVELPLGSTSSSAVVVKVIPAQYTYNGGKTIDLNGDGVLTTDAYDTYYEKLSVTGNIGYTTGVVAPEYRIPEPQKKVYLSPSFDAVYDVNGNIAYYHFRLSVSDAATISDLNSHLGYQEYASGAWTDKTISWQPYSVGGVYQNIYYSDAIYPANGHAYRLLGKNLSELKSTGSWHGNQLKVQLSGVSFVAAANKRWVADSSSSAYYFHDTVSHPANPFGNPTSNYAVAKVNNTDITVIYPINTGNKADFTADSVKNGSLCLVEIDSISSSDCVAKKINIKYAEIRLKAGTQSTSDYGKEWELVITLDNAAVASGDTVELVAKDLAWSEVAYNSGTPYWASRRLGDPSNINMGDWNGFGIYDSLTL